MRCRSRSCWICCDVMSISRFFSEVTINKRIIVNISGLKGFRRGTGDGHLTGRKMAIVIETWKFLFCAFILTSHFRDSEFFRYVAESWYWGIPILMTISVEYVDYPGMEKRPVEGSKSQKQEAKCLPRNWIAMDLVTPASSGLSSVVRSILFRPRHSLCELYIKLSTPRWTI